MTMYGPYVIFVILRSCTASTVQFPVNCLGACSCQFKQTGITFWFSILGRNICSLFCSLLMVFGPLFALCGFFLSSSTAASCLPFWIHPSSVPALLSHFSMKNDLPGNGMATPEGALRATPTASAYGERLRRAPTASAYGERLRRTPTANAYGEHYQGSGQLSQRGPARGEAATVVARVSGSVAGRPPKAGG